MRFAENPQKIAINEKKEIKHEKGSKMAAQIICSRSVRQGVAYRELCPHVNTTDDAQK